MSPGQIAHRVGVPTQRLQQLMKAQRSQLADTHVSPLWTGALDLVSERIGLLQGIRAELEAKLDQDRQRVLERRKRIAER